MYDQDHILRLDRLDVTARRVFVLADLDSARSAQGAVHDDLPIRVLLPTLRYLVGRRSKVVLATRLTTPSRDAAKTAIAGLSERLAELLGAPVRTLGPNLDREIRDLAEAEVAIAPDLTTAPESALWAANLARTIDVYVLEGLKAALDGGPSAVDLARLIPARGVGYAVEAALDIHHDAISAPAPERYAFVLGGRGLRRLAPVARAILGECNDLLVGGAVASTILVALGWRPGGTPYEADAIDVAKEIIELARSRGVALHLPVDALVRDRRVAAAYDDRPLDRPLEAHEAMVDLGLETCNAYQQVLATAATIVWVGLMGECTTQESQRGSLRIGLAMANAARPIAAGDDTVQAIRVFRLDQAIRSAPGGDAVVSLLAGEPFPGLDALLR